MFCYIILCSAVKCNAVQCSEAQSSAVQCMFSQGTTIGPCPDHVTGRQPGVECDKCDFILNASKLGEDSWSAARTANKALKCPKCNWHYKYQETLEVHMKEKHKEMKDDKKAESLECGKILFNKHAMKLCVNCK